ncbi:MAG: PaaX family transcriptional regulator [Rhodobacteraceae bacterium]|nr:PaaX family transcriptional regulator [Paracoccaceae bacterium]
MGQNLHTAQLTGLHGALGGVLADFQPTATSFIVTIYGDVVEPRGGVLWMGTLIDICAAVGVSETLTRTAVSRLVAAGQLIGERAGRRSFYRLSPDARAEYSLAARLLFDPPPTGQGWLIVSPKDADEDRLIRAGFAPLGPGVFIGPDRPRVGAAVEGLTFRAEVVQDAASLPGFAAAHWDMAQHADAYTAFLARFAPLVPVLGAEQVPPCSGRLALVARLALVHAYRAAVLRDPGLPKAALPPDWPGATARGVFARLYLGLSPLADSHVGKHFKHANGHLPVATPATEHRLASLGRAPGGWPET